MEEQMIRQSVIDAGLELVENGLIARTWGNISARLSDTWFLITPSGLAYDSLSPEDLVAVNMEDMTWEGDLKPSSEKGVHAEVYKLRPEVQFVIHTHQFYATAVGSGGKPVLMPYYPLAAYGLPGTKMLRKNVRKAVEDFPSSDAVLMRNHGALCMGTDKESAFAAARRLEEVCEKKYHDKVDITLNKVRSLHEVQMPQNLLDAAETVARYAVPVVESEVLAISRTGKTLHPIIDDLAQIGGVEIKCVSASEKKVKEALKGRNAVLVHGYGAICTGDTPEDARAVAMILHKNCASALYRGTLKGLSYPDAAIQRYTYVTKYGKQMATHPAPAQAEESCEPENGEG